MGKSSTIEGADIPYIRGIVPMSLVVFVLVFIPSVIGIIHIIIKPEVRELKYIFGLLFWIFLSYLFASSIRVKISFLNNGIIVKDGLWGNVRRFFFPYNEIKNIRIDRNRLSVKMGKFSPYRYLIKEDDLYLLQKGMKIYEKWRKENEVKQNHENG